MKEVYTLLKTMLHFILTEKLFYNMKKKTVFACSEEKR